MEVFVDQKTIYSHYQNWLQEEFSKRKRRNLAYSMRSFSNLLGMDSSSVSQLLSGKRKASLKMIKSLCVKLDASEDQLLALLETQNKFIRGYSKSELNKHEEYRQLSMDSYALMADWYHYAILELTFTPSFNDDPKWISKLLNISILQASTAFERLKRLGLLVEENGKIVKAETFITNFSKGQSSEALKELQRSVLELGIDAIDNCKQSEKDITSMTFAIDESKLPRAVDKIKEFRREMCQFLETGSQERVYHLGIQLYPVSKKGEIYEK
jgi:uncharacterized protein (TIGR02147 family)